MPEMPEVETTKRGVEPYVINQPFNQVIIRQQQLRWPIPKDLAKNITRKKLLGLSRRAKYLLFHFSTGTMLIHLGMSGHLHIVKQNTPAQKHDHVDFLLGNNYSLRYTDPRRFGAILWTDIPADEHPLLCKLGPEPLSTNFNSRYLATACNKRRQPIKQAIMDNHVVVGVGNIYASESLFHAKINPNRAAAELTTAEYQALTKSIKHILKKAIKAGGTTLKDFLHADGKPGYFRHQLQVYGRAEADCYDCNSKILSQRISQRNTFYCPTCQI